MEVSRKGAFVLQTKNSKGLFNIRALFFLVLWYFFSGCTLFLNKYILSSEGSDPTCLGASQMLMTAFCGFLQMYFPCGMFHLTSTKKKPSGFLKHMCLVGCTRFLTVVLGLVALNFVAVSFTETVKSSAPIFTVVISQCVLGEQIGLYVRLSLIPIMSGLALCSATELSFNMLGFLAAMSTNITECLQNVYSKMLISGEKYNYNPAELQFYTSVASIVIQIPASFLLVDITSLQNMMNKRLLTLYLMNGAFFHFQSITAYVLMDYVSPVTHSVANTVKRAFLIWMSVLLFDNTVTLLSGLGTLIVFFGVLLYNKAQNCDLQEQNSKNLVDKDVREI